jgi:hypothetical protein
LDLID